MNCHDDNYLRRADLSDQLAGDWLILANGRYPQAPEAYVRGSFEFWKREMLELLGGKFDLGSVAMTREGKSETPYHGGMDAIAAWNDIGIPLRSFLVRRGLHKRVSYLSPHYRISPWAIEGERGFLHWTNGAPWSVEAGLRAFPLEVARS